MATGASLPTPWLFLHPHLEAIRQTLDDDNSFAFIHERLLPWIFLDDKRRLLLHPLLSATALSDRRRQLFDIVCQQLGLPQFPHFINRDDVLSALSANRYLAQDGDRIAVVASDMTPDTFPLNLVGHEEAIEVEGELLGPLDYDQSLPKLETEGRVTGA